MYKPLSFLLIASFFTVSESSAMRDNRTDNAKARLQKKLVQKDKDVVELKSVLTHMGMCLDTFIKEQKLAAQILDPSANNFSVID